jgi:hypothetical protein
MSFFEKMYSSTIILLIYSRIASETDTLQNILTTTIPLTHKKTAEMAHTNSAVFYQAMKETVNA